MDEFIADRIVTYQRVGRLNYTWWRYLIKGTKISMFRLKEAYPTLDAIFLALIRDREFVLRITYKVKDVPKYKVIKKITDSTYEFYIQKDEEKELILTTDKEYRQLTKDIVDLEMFKLLYVLHAEFPKYLRLVEKSDSRQFKLYVSEFENNQTFKRSLDDCYDKFKKLNVTKEIDLYISKHFGGFSLKGIIKLYDYRLCHNWHEISPKNGRNFYHYISKFYGKNMLKFFIVYLRSGETIKLKSNKKIVKYYNDLMKNSGVKF